MLEGIGLLDRNENVLEVSRKNVPKLLTVTAYWLLWQPKRSKMNRARAKREKTTFATAKTAKQKFSRATDHFFVISTQQTVDSKY